MLRYPHKSKSAIAAFVGQSIWERTAPLDAYGHLSEAANPWLMQYFDDLDAVAKINSSFRAVWHAFAWNAFYEK